METFLRILIDVLPVLILSAVLIYLFHETLRYLEARDKRITARQAAEPHVSGNAPMSETVLNLRMQAAERFALYLERINPGRLVMRLHRSGMSAAMLQNEILRTIREEFDHNLSQQIYVSETSWELIKNAKEEMIKFVSATGSGMKEKASGLDFSRKLFEAASKIEKLPSEIALAHLRAETKRFF